MSAVSRAARVLMPTHCEVPRSVTCPEVLSSWRSRTLSEAEIVAQAEREFRLRRDGLEVVFTPGHVLRADATAIWRAIQSLQPEIKIRQILHWTQALSLKRQADEWRRDVPGIKFEIAVDAKLSRVSLELLAQTWNADWLIVPRPDWDADLALQAFVEIERGRRSRPSTEPLELMLLCPRPTHHEGPFLDNDELQLFLDEARDAFPDVCFVPAPPSYFLSSELGTLARDESREIWPPSDHSSRQTVDLSIICPVKSLNFPETLKRLRILRENAPFSTELIIVRDDGGTFTPQGDEIWLAMPARPLAEDWRAGSVRNLGARVACGQHLLFVDADVRLPLEAFKQIEAAWRSHPRLNSAHKAGAWWSASSSCWILPREEFWAAGGFSEAFSTYGCEDGELAFRLQALGFSTDPLPFTITHLRPESPEDLGLAKMLKLQTAAQLLHRLTLSAETHFVFYSVMGSAAGSSAAIWAANLATIRPTIRVSLKRLWDFPIVGWFLKASTEVMTLVESREKAKFIQGWLHHGLWVFKGPLLLVMGETWRVRIFGDVARLHAWKLPHALAWPLHQTRRLYGQIAGPQSRAIIAITSAVQSKSWLIPHSVKWPFYVLGRGLGQIAGPLHAAWIRAWSSRFGLRPFFGLLWAQRHWPRVWTERILGQTRKWTTRTYWLFKAFMQDLVQILDQMHWRIRILCLRTWGHTKAFTWRSILHPTWEMAGRIYAWLGEKTGRIYAWLGEKTGRIYAWMCEKLLGPIWANRWLLREPTAWFELNCPSFHRIVWKRLLKLRYFLTYQWQARVRGKLSTKSNTGAEP